MNLCAPYLIVIRSLLVVLVRKRNRQTDRVIHFLIDIARFSNMGTIILGNNSHFACVPLTLQHVRELIN